LPVEIRIFDWRKQLDGVLDSLTLDNRIDRIRRNILEFFRSPAWPLISTFFIVASAPSPKCSR
jgi:hypothetical protein